MCKSFWNRLYVEHHEQTGKQVPSDLLVRESVKSIYDELTAISKDF